jgi:hypothetical protein
MSSQPHETTQADVLRDARLIQALWHMPDAHDMPDAALRSRVLQAAGDALLPPATAQPVNAAKITLAQQLRNAWRTGWCWLADPSSERMPWTGALASLLLASLITVMWTGREPPETPAQGDPVPTAADAPPQPGLADTRLPSVPETTRAAPVTAPQPDAPAPRAKPGLPDPAGDLAKSTAASAAPVAGARPPAPLAATAPGSFESTVSDAQPAPRSQTAHAAETVPPAAPQSITPAARLAKASPAPQVPTVTEVTVRVSLDGQTHILRAEQASLLLAALRTLSGPAATATDVAPLPGEKANAVAASPAPGLAERRETERAAFSVETSAGERWDISAGQVRIRQGEVVGTQALTRAQWLQLRALALPSGSP